MFQGCVVVIRLLPAFGLLEQGIWRKEEKVAVKTKSLLSKVVTWPFLWRINSIWRAVLEALSLVWVGAGFEDSS